MKRLPRHPVTIAALLVFSLACRRTTTCEGDTVVATVNGQPITMTELDRLSGKDLYKLRESVLQRMINDRLLEDAAKKAGLARTDYLRKELEQRYQPVSDAEAQGFFDRNKDHLQFFKGKEFADVKQMIVQRMGEERRHRASGIISEELRSKADIRINLRMRVLVDPSGPSRGPANAKVTVIEYSEYQCPICNQGRQLMERVLKEYGNKVRVVFRDYPLAMHAEARKAAEAAHCADEQGKFWEMHDWMFDHPESLKVEDLKAGVRKLGIDGLKFDSCLDSGRQTSKVDDNIRAGQSYGITGTPAFFVNGALIEGVTSYDTIKAEIDHALAQ